MLYLVLVVFWSTKVLNKLLFSVHNVALVSQIIAIISQSWSVLFFTIITFAVQVLAVDRTIRQRKSSTSPSDKLNPIIWGTSPGQTAAILNDKLNAWLGLVSAAKSTLRSGYGGQDRFSLSIIVLFFASVAVLSVSAPSVLVATVTNSTSVVSSKAIATPSDILTMRNDTDTWSDIRFTMASLPSLWEQQLGSAKVGLSGGFSKT
jgi:hypothetical protein